MAFMDDLADMFTDEMAYQRVVKNRFGKFIPSGQIVSIPCRVEGSVRLIRDGGGNEVVSSMRAITRGYYALDADNYQFTLPTRFIPSGQLRSISVFDMADETGPIAQTVFFP